MTADLDLFGDAEPVRKGGTGYLERLTDLPYPDGWTFWSLAQAVRPKQLPNETTEMVWLCAPGRQFLAAAVDIRDGRVLQGGIDR